MKFIFEHQLAAGELIEIRSPYLYGSSQDSNVRRLISQSPLNKFRDLSERKRDHLVGRIQQIFGFFNIRNFSKRNPIRSTFDFGPVIGLAMELLISSGSQDVIVFTVLGQGDHGMKLLSEITSYLRKSGSRFLIINYGSNEGFPDLGIFDPVLIKHIDKDAM